jgi:cell shape-determining protein MreC
LVEIGQLQHENKQLREQMNQLEQLHSRVDRQKNQLIMAKSTGGDEEQTCFATERFR